MDTNTKKRATIILSTTVAMIFLIPVTSGMTTFSIFPYIDSTRMKEQIITGQQEGDSNTDGYIIWPEGYQKVAVASVIENTQSFRTVGLRYRHFFDVDYKITQRQDCTLRFGFDYDYMLSGEITAKELNNHIENCFKYFEQVFRDASYHQVSDTQELINLYQKCFDYVNNMDDYRIRIRYYPSYLSSEAPIYLPSELLPNTF